MSSCSNRPIHASSIPEVDQVHDSVYTALPTTATTQQQQQQQQRTPSPIIEDIPSPQYHLFTSIDLPLCQSTSAPHSTRYEAMNLAQRRFEFGQSSINSGSRSIKHGISERPTSSSAVMSESRNVAGNAFPEKRQSDPQIRYAFCNRGFEVFSRTRRLSFNQSESRRKAMPLINEYSFEEDLEYYRIKQWPANSLNSNDDDIVPVPQLKIRVSKERNDASFESSSPDEYSDSYCEMGDLIDDDWFNEEYNFMQSELVDPFWSEDDDGQKHNKTNVTHGIKCSKCGHKCLVKQFTDSFA